MSEEELIETLRAFEKNRVEQLEEPARNLFYAIMKIAGERDRLNNIIVKLKKVLWQRCEEARKNEQYVRLNCYKDILNELVNTIYEVDGETNE